MKGMLAILAFEVRLMRRDLLLGGAILSAVFVGLLFGQMQGSGTSLSPTLRGGVLAVLVLIGVTRAVSIDATWADLRASLPVAPLHVALSRFALWATLALPSACAYVLWVTAAPEPPFAHMFTVWLWILVAGMAVGQLSRIRRVGGRGGDALFVVLPGMILLNLLPGVVSHGETWLGVEASWGTLVVILLFWMMHELSGAQEYLPSQSPKEVRPRSRWVGGLLKRRTRPRSPAQVRAHLGVNGAQLRPTSFLLVGCAGFLVVAALTTEVSSRGGGSGSEAAFAVLISGLYVSIELRQASARWAFLRTYPLSRASVWAGPLVAMVVVPVACIGSALALQRGVHPAGVAANVAFDGEQPSSSSATRWRPALRAPGWVFTEGATRGRPAGMPAPAWGQWPLRVILELRISRGGRTRTWETDAAEVTDERRYFVEAVRFYLDLVHGVEVADADLETALGDPLVVDADTEVIPAQHFYEYAYPRGLRVLSFFQEEGNIRFFMDGSGERARRLGIPTEHRATELFGATPSSMYAFAPALERLQTRLADRLERAALFRSVLDLCLLLLAVLLFVRFALIDGPLCCAMPLLPLVAIGLWFNGRATFAYRTIRDAHLAYPWLAPVFTLALAILLLISIRRQVGRATPPVLARQETRV